MTTSTWQEDLNRLIWRSTGFGICPDVTEMDQTALWGCYCRLKRMGGL